MEDNELVNYFSIFSMHITFSLTHFKPTKTKHTCIWMVCSFSESWSIYYIFFIHHYKYAYLGFTRILRLPPRKWISCISIIVELNQSLKNKYSSGIALYYNSEKHLMNNFQKDQSNHCYLKWKSKARLLWEITMSFCCLFFREFYLWQMQWWDRLHVRWYKYWVVGGYIQTYRIRGGFKQHSLRLFELRCREW